MKRTILTMVILLAFAVGASASVPQPFSIYVGGAISLPTSPETFNAAFNNGWHGSAGLGWKFAPNFQAVGKIEFHKFSANLEGLPIDGGDNSFLMFGADARFSLGVPAAPIKPFFFGGLGFARNTQSEFTGSSLITSILNTGLPATRTQMYWNIGAGVDLKTGPAWSLFAQARYVGIINSGGSLGFIPITLGLKFF